MIKKTKPGHSGKKIKGKPPSEKAGSSAWGQKLSAMLREKLQTVNLKKVIAMNIPYIIFFYVVEKEASRRWNRSLPDLSRRDGSLNNTI